MHICMLHNTMTKHGNIRTPARVLYARVLYTRLLYASATALSVISASWPALTPKLLLLRGVPIAALRRSQLVGEGPDKRPKHHGGAKPGDE
jgi:hypothetical protein